MIVMGRILFYIKPDELDVALELTITIRTTIMNNKRKRRLKN